MKLVTYVHRYTPSCGILTPTGIIDIPSCTDGLNKLHSIKEILIKGQKSLDILYGLSEKPREHIPPESITWLAPIPRPGKIIALAGNYQKHLEETAWQDPTFQNQAATTNPWPFLMPPNVVLATNTQIPWPAYSEEVDYEIELAVFIGNTAEKVSPEQASKHIAGYSIANDISARSVTFKEGRTNRPRDVFFDWLMGKWANGFLPIGPCFVTADEIKNPQSLNLELKVNGQIRQQADTSQMIFDVYQIVSFMSHLMTLEAGDVIITGTPHGVAAANGRYLNPGDMIECTIENIGTLKNTLGPKPDTFYNGFIR
ncbi:MAG: fumarylacetoacetate hydrolase family protein [Phycisphaerae bacterium]|nr:fumarylacetoacetate hydrolase family protein [Phycisphaerae bacterium]